VNHFKLGTTPHGYETLEDRRILLNLKLNSWCTKIAYP
jgi:hypothetical protein